MTKNRRFGDLNQWLLLAAVVAVLAGAVWGSRYDQRLLTLAGVYALLVLGYQFIFGHAGALSLAQGSFFGLGAYITAILGAQFDQGFTVTFPSSIALPALLAALVAVPMLRLQTHYFALATLALGQTMLLIATNAEGLTGGANGLPGIPPITIAGLTVDRGTPLLAIVWLCVAAGALLSWQLTRGLYGRGYTILRAAPLVASALGIDTGGRRLTAFVLSAGYAGAAGALYAHTIRVVSPEALSFSIMVICLTMTVIGGRLQVSGAVVGALLLTHLPEWFRPLQEYYLVANGAVLLAAVLFAPVGIAGLAQRFGARSQTRLPTPTIPRRGSATPPPNVRLAVNAVSKNYGGIAALDNVTLEVADGEIVGLVGPNGSGKTTLANLLSGFDRPDSGTLTLNGQELSRLPPHRIAGLGLARSFQTPQMPPGLSVLDTVALARSNIEAVSAHQALRDFGPQTALDRTRQDAMTILQHHELADNRDRPASSLPHGTRRRIDIARTLAAEPRLVILDEPAAGLTATEAGRIAALLRDAAANGTSLLIIEHDMSFLLPLADRLICLDQGRIVATGTPDAIVNQPALRQAYFGLAP